MTFNTTEGKSTPFLGPQGKIHVGISYTQRSHSALNPPIQLSTKALTPPKMVQVHNYLIAQTNYEVATHVG